MVKIKNQSIMVNLKELSDANLDRLAEKCGIKLTAWHRSEEKESARIDPKKL
jgi:hypothetical protein